MISQLNGIGKYLQQMSSYIIAGSADSRDTAYCEEVARRVKAKYKNIDFRVVIKHPHEWEDYLNQICRIYGFLNKTNPIIYTYHGKIIGNKDAFINNVIKYFGLEPEAINIPQITTKVNVKLAEEELHRKKIIKTNFKTLPQKIDHQYNSLLKSGAFKHSFNAKQQFLVNGIEYYFQESQGLCPPKKFPQAMQIKVEKQEVEASNIDIMALSLQDQIQPEEGVKDTFVTNNQALNTESMEKMSEASRTNKLQSSAISRDGADSKQNKESNTEKQKIVEQFDDVADFTDHRMQNLSICELGDNFYLSFEKQGASPFVGEMLIYHNEEGNCIRVYNDGRGVIGHHTLIKEIHYIHDENAGNSIQEAQNVDGIDQEGEKVEVEGEGEGEGEKKQQREEGEAQKQQEKSKSKSKQEQGKEQKKEQIAIKSKTEPNIPENPVEEAEQISEPDSNLNLISNLNYHTLYILKPLSVQELKMTLFTVRESNSVACIQFLPENPNPKIKVYNRHLLLENRDSLFPVEKFIMKQLDENEIEEVTISPDQCDNEDQAIRVLRIKELNFSHFLYSHSEKTDGEELARILKLTIDELLNLQEKLKKEIGYNIIFTKDYTIVVALTEPYKVYGSSNIYFDGLAYLGYVNLPKLVEGYVMKKQAEDMSEVVPAALARCSGFEAEE